MRCRNYGQAPCRYVKCRYVICKRRTPSSSGSRVNLVPTPASLRYTRRPMIGRQNCTSVGQGDNNKHTHYPQGISGQRRKLRLLKKMSRKSLLSFLEVLHCCSLFIVCVLLFPWIYQQATVCGAAMRSDVYVARGYRHTA